jgi:hypothetical protein
MIYDLRFLKWEVPEGVPFSTRLLAQNFQDGVALPQKGKWIEQEGAEETENQSIQSGFRNVPDMKGGLAIIERRNRPIERNDFTDGGRLVRVGTNQ